MAREAKDNIVGKWQYKSISYCRERTAQVFQKWVRLSNAVNGKLQCVTCGKRGPVGQFDAGHFISRRHNTTLLDEANCHPQCKRCNRYLNGNYENYLEFMMDRYGMKKVRTLLAKAKRHKQFNREELADLFVYYRDKIDELEQK